MKIPMEVQLLQNMQLGDRYHHIQMYDSFCLFTTTLKINLLILYFSSYVQLFTIYYLIQNGSSIHSFTHVLLLFFCTDSERH